jgi:anti-sigma regulatory factor (Ser/Thr protein kinase)
MKRPVPLTFAAVDGLGFAAANGRLAANQTTRYLPASLGPLLELLCLAVAGRVPSTIVDSWLTDNGARPMIAAFHNREECWIKPDDRRMGFIRAARMDQDEDALFTRFLMDAQRAAREVARLPGSTPGQLTAAMRELESNIHEHSDAPGTGLLAFRAAPDAFEFVAADGGIGILRSLQRCSIFADLDDHGKAIQAALSDGTSRFGTDSRRGHGFRPIFLGLANLRGALRFRSGDHALVIDGTSPALSTAQLAQKPVIDGFFASIRCEASPSRQPDRVTP